MKKSDVILAKKTILAHQVKMESQQIKEELRHRRPSTTSNSLSNSTVRSLRMINSRSGNNLGASTSSLLPSPLVRSADARPPTSGSAATSSSRQTGTNVLDSSFSSTRVLYRSVSTPTSQHFDGSGLYLANELAQRSVTNTTSLRKTQAAVSKTIDDELSQSASRSTLTSIAEQPISEVELNDQNYFMPKKKIFRADGASLHDIYLSKTQDFWGKMLKAQTRDYEEQKVQERLARHQVNDTYSRLLREQVASTEARKHQQHAELYGTPTNNFLDDANDATARWANLQQQREEAAKARQRTFVKHALEDIAMKEKLRQEALTTDLRASTIMINQAKQWIAEEEEKKVHNRSSMKEYQDKIYQENLDNIRRRQENKHNSHAEDKRIIEEQERIYQRERARRDEEMSQRVKRSTEGPAHHIVQKIVNLKLQKDNDLYSTLFHADNSLNKQLYTSEMAAKSRAKANGHDLDSEWQARATWKQQRKIQDAERLQQVQAEALRQHALAEAQDLEKQRQKQRAQRSYQASLDAQLSESRQRSFDNLTKTMSAAEMRLNADLIRKTGFMPA